MNVTTYANAAEFLRTVADWLEREESLNNMILGHARRLAAADKPSNPPAVLMTVSGSAGLEAVNLMTPPRGVILYAPGIGTDRHDLAVEALNALADALLAGGYAVPECLGPKAAALAFVQLWAKCTGRSFTLKTAQRIYELRKVTFPVGVSGAARLPREEELDIVADWTDRFSVGIGASSDLPAARASAKELMEAGRMLFWEDAGRPVSMAAAQRALPHGISVSRVYTPPEHRGHGYASACVAALSQRQLDAGRQFCCLYTDLANPTSNSIYQKIGYVPVADSSHYEFSTGTVI